MPSAAARTLLAAGTVIGEHDGELVKTLGDGVMAVFALATQAVDCAVAAQARFLLKEGPVSLPGVRVGLSVGEASWTRGRLPRRMR